MRHLRFDRRHYMNPLAAGQLGPGTKSLGGQEVAQVHADTLVFDLDPGPGVERQCLTETALRNRLRRSFTPG
jgi:hypothetical protein